MANPWLSYFKIAKGFKSLFDSSDEEEEEGAVSEPQEISNDLDEQQERYQAAHLQGTPSCAFHAGVSSRILPTGCGVWVSNVLGAPQGPRELNNGRTSRDPMSVPRFKTNHVLSTTSKSLGIRKSRKKPDDRGGRFPVWGYPWVQPENTTIQTQAEDNATKIVGSANPGTVHRKAAKKPRTTYAPAVADTRPQQPSGSQPGAGLQAPTSSVTRGIPATSLAAGASQNAAALGRPAPHDSGACRSDQGGQEELSHAFEYEAPSQPYPSGPSSSGRDSVGSLLSDEVRQLRDRIYAIEIALGLGPGGQATAQAGNPGALKALCQDVGALSRKTRGLHWRVDRRVPASTQKELRRGLDALSHEVHGRMPSYETQGYSYHSAYGTQRIVVPLKAPHVDRRVRRHCLRDVNGGCHAMSGQDRKGSDEA
ncbi:ATP-binding cassette (ABC) Superfamily, partial [Phytophthora palmivora]